MEKTLWLADVHVCARYLGVVATEEDTITAFTQAVDFCIARGIQRLGVAGDMFDNNKPPAHLVAKVKAQVTRANMHGISCVGISGDHDKIVGASSWMQVCDFETDSLHPDLVMVDYQDNPEEVLTALQRKLEQKRNTVECVVLHGQVPELFPFCEDKKTLPLKDLNLCQYPNLKAVVVGDIHSAPEGELTDPSCRDHGIQIAYPGSLVALNAGEHEKKGYLLWNGVAFEREAYSPPRVIIDKNLSAQDLASSEYRTAFEHALEFLADQQPSPLVVLRYPSGCEEEVRRIKIPSSLLTFYGKVSAVTEQAQAILPLRQELQAENRLTEALTESCHSQAVFDLAWRLLQCEKTGTDPMTVLQTFKEENLK